MYELCFKLFRTYFWKCKQCASVREWTQRRQLRPLFSKKVEKCFQKRFQKDFMLYLKTHWKSTVNGFWLWKTLKYQMACMNCVSNSSVLTSRSVNNACRCVNKRRGDSWGHFFRKKLKYAPKSGFRRILCYIWRLIENPQWTDVGAEKILKVKWHASIVFQTLPHVLLEV